MKTNKQAKKKTVAGAKKKPGSSLPAYQSYEDGLVRPIIKRQNTDISMYNYLGILATQA